MNTGNIDYTEQFRKRSKCQCGQTPSGKNKCDIYQACKAIYGSEWDGLGSELREQLAEEYAEHGILCITPEEFASNPEILDGLEDIELCAEAYYFFEGNADIPDSEWDGLCEPSECTAEKITASG